MRLYYSPGACSLASHVTAREAGIEVQLVKVDLSRKVTGSGQDFRQINPRGSVPALEFTDGTVLTEGAVVMQFLADKAPGTRLLPVCGTFERYRALEWLNFVATELHKTFGPLWRKDTPGQMRTIVTDMLGAKFDIIEGHLLNQDYLHGQNFGIADAYAFTVLSWTPVVEIDLARWPNIKDFVARIAARPSVRAALMAEGLLDGAP